MKVLVIGNGGREHALVWKVAQSSKVEKIYCVPGNPGIGKLATCVEMDISDIDALVAFAKGEEIDLTIVGPEVPLALGIVDVFSEAGLKIFGPSQKAALLESSKAFSKDFMAKHAIPTAAFGTFADIAAAKNYLTEIDMPCVIKMDGLAAGKGVFIVDTIEEAVQILEKIMLTKDSAQGENKVVIEEFLEGEEVSIIAFADGQEIVPLAWARDHKKIYEGEQGPNTGGMGAVSCPSFYDEQLNEEILVKILRPTIEAMAKEGRKFKGVLFTGLMLTSKGPKVLEYNVRFGDPETQVILMRLENDLVDIMEAVIAEKLAELEISWKKAAAACVILASGGYPDAYPKGFPIEGLEKVAEDIVVFHAGTAEQDGQVVTAGGRVLGVTALGADLSEALQKIYGAIATIEFQDMYYRKDIGKKLLGVM